MHRTRKPGHHERMILKEMAVSRSRATHCRRHIETQTYASGLQIRDGTNLGHSEASKWCLICTGLHTCETGLTASESYILYIHSSCRCTTTTPVPTCIHIVLSPPDVLPSYSLTSTNPPTTSSPIMLETFSRTIRDYLPSLT